jgi:hypothetical protein
VLLLSIDSSVTISPTAVSYAANVEPNVNTTTNTTLVAGSKEYLFGSPVISIAATDGFIAKVSNEVPDLADAIKVETTNDWANANFFYLAEETWVQTVRRLTGGGASALTSVYQTHLLVLIKSEELSYGLTLPGKAYRYLERLCRNSTSFQKKLLCLC